MADDLSTALRNRFEADALLGARALPICPPVSAGPRAPSPSAAPTTGRATIAGRGPAPIDPRIEVDLPERPPVAAEEIERRRVALSVIDNDEVKGCTHCGLHTTRTKTVFGVGSAAARIMFIGEAPGADEDASGEPFVGRAGQLLTDMIQKGMGLKREDVYICNVLKCRPPNNRTPAIDEIIACKGYLWRQIEIIMPQVIITLGAPAAQTILNTREGIGKLRSRWHNFYVSGSETIGEPIPVMPTFHPAYLLRSPGEKAKAWADLKMVMGRLGIPIPGK
ncbi:MAG: uracil-DNA glycosylase [Planctomycetes bacterium]|nr:uracil-DNA glycosylase [Planctomycetota bacterium]